MTVTDLAASVPTDPPEPFTDLLRLAVAAYLARFKGSSREHTESDLRCYLAWCAERGLGPAGRPAAAPGAVHPVDTSGSACASVTSVTRLRRSAPSTCHHIAIDNTLYDNVTHQPAWRDLTGPPETSRSTSWTSRNSWVPTAAGRSPIRSPCSTPQRTRASARRPCEWMAPEAPTPSRSRPMRHPARRTSSAQRHPTGSSSAIYGGAHTSYPQRRRVADRWRPRP
jgi:hypothetical protein